MNQELKVSTDGNYNADVRACARMCVFERKKGLAYT